MVLELQRIDMLPERIKGPEGYYYPDEFVDKMFLYANDIVFITKTAIYQFPYIIFAKFFEETYKSMKDKVIEESAITIADNAKTELYEEVLQMIKDNVVENVYETTADEIKNMLIEDVSKKIDTKLDEVGPTVIEIVENYVKEYFENNKNDIVNAMVNQCMPEIERKLEEKYDKIINEKLLQLESILKKEKEDKAKGEKMSLSQLMALKEMFTAEEIVKMREAGIL